MKGLREENNSLREKNPLNLILMIWTIRQETKLENTRNTHE